MVSSFSQLDIEQINKLGNNLNPKFKELFHINNLNSNEKIYVYKEEEKVLGFIHISINYEVVDLFAYNALFDQGILSELKNYNWYDIMQVAAYRQYNNAIPYTYECYKTGRLKKNYGVQPIYQMLSGDYSYIEKHNALTDAIDESMIMKMLECDISVYKKIES